MSFFSNLFTRKLTYLNTVCRDEFHKDILHVFGAIRVVPEDGDSFDIWRHCVLDLNSFRITNGLQQTGNDFNINSPFAQRALEHMASLLGRQLGFAKKHDEDDDDEDVYADDYVPAPDGPDLEENCEVEIADVKKNDSDTTVLPKRLRSGLLFTELNSGDKERFSLEVMKSGVSLGTHLLNGDPDYFRHILLFRERNQVLITYRKTNWLGGGGMAFIVLNYGTGEKVFDGYLA